jgi:hypothetical protein
MSGAARTGHGKTRTTEVEPIATRLDEVVPTVTKWLWEAWIPLGKLTLLAGHPGEGKSRLTLDVAARVSSGLEMPDGTAGLHASGVVLISAEDAADDTIVPRLQASGADLKRIHLLTGFRQGDGREQGLSSLGESPALAALEQSIDKCGARLVVVDPLSAFFGKLDSHKNPTFGIYSSRSQIWRRGQAARCFLLST